MKKYLFVICCLVLSHMAQAEVVTVKGVGTTSYNTTLTANDKDKAYRSAQVAAVERYFAENGDAQSQNFEDIQPQIEENLDKFILSTTVINEQNQVGLLKYSVSVRVELNVSKLRNILRKSSAIGKAGNHEKSRLVYVFVGREVASVRSFDARVVKRAESSEKVSANGSKVGKGSEGEAISDVSVSTSTSKHVKQNININTSVKVETGGSTTLKADDVAYRLLPMTNSKTSISSVFSQAGFIVADPEFVLGDKDFKAINHDFSTGSDLSPSTMRAVVLSMRKAQIPLFVIATLDVGAPGVDSASGLPRASVSVTARVLDLTGNLPREVASVPVIQKSGVADNNQDAVNKGLKEASLAAATEVVSRLNAAGIR